MLNQASPDPIKAATKWFEIATAGLILAVVGILYHRVLGMWWNADDPMVLWHVSRFGPAQYFANPEVWRSFNPASLTPWMLFSLDIDLSVFGLSPTGFYLRQLAALGLAGIALFGCLRLYLSVVASAIGGLALLVAPATAEIACNLATRHYVEGLLFGCLAFTLYTLSLRRSDWRLTVLAAVCYALALSAKEIFAPLPVLLLLLPQAELRQRIRRLTPFAVVVLAYVGWRNWMLGSFIGGYRPRRLPTVSEVSVWIDSVVNDTGMSPATLTLGFTLAVGVGLIALLRCPPPWRLFWLGFLVCVVLPVVPVLHVYSPRHSFAVVVFAATSASVAAQWFIGVSGGKAGRWSAGIFGIGVLVVAGSAVPDMLPSVDQVLRVRAEGVEVLKGGDRNRVVVAPHMPYWHFFGLLRLREQVLNLAPGPGVVTEPCLVDALGGRGGSDRWRPQVFDPAGGRLVAIPVSGRSCRFDGSAPLSVAIRYDRGTNSTSWQLGPVTHGRYTVLWAMAENSLVGIDVPSKGELLGNTAFQMGVEVVVAFQSPDGWKTLSPRLRGSGRMGKIEIEWSRLGSPEGEPAASTGIMPR